MHVVMNLKSALPPQSSNDTTSVTAVQNLKKNKGSLRNV